MKEQVNLKKETIEVSVEILSEVKLFITLLEAGEIDGVGGLLQKLNGTNIVDLANASENLSELELTEDQEEGFFKLKLFQV